MELECQIQGEAALWLGTAPHCNPHTLKQTSIQFVLQSALNIPVLQSALVELHL